MKKWLVDGTVELVEADLIIGDKVAVRCADGHAFMARARDLFDTENEARREHIDREACALEELADKHDRQRVDAEVLASGHIDDAEWNRGKAAEARARAKRLRGALAETGEVKDATDGRR